MFHISVQRIGRTYEVRGMLQNITSYSSATVGDGAIINDVERVYNSFEQCTAEYQEHNGAVNTSTSPKVGYEYADGSANTIRQTGLAYPDGRLLTMDYGPGGGIDDALSRVASLIDNDGVTHLVDYARIGTDTFVQASSPQPQIAWSLINGAGIDPYTGLDPFNRVVDNRWFNTTTSADLDRIQHGYDRGGNRLWRKNTVAEAVGVYLDELYAYDGVYRLERLDRGQLNGTNTGIVAGTEDFAQAWGLDATGNWSTFDEADTGGAWTLEQTRTSNTVNEITGISGGGWVVPAYDAAGNMTTTPQPALPTAGLSGVYDAWNRLISFSASGSPIGGYLYDGLNRRVSKLVSAVLRDIFYTAAWQAIEERIGGSSSADRQFILGLRYIDDLVLRDRGTERLYGIQDPNWNMTALVDATGAIQERYSYAAYGLPTVLTPTFAVRGTSSFDWETLFAGYRWDSESGLYLSRNRNLTSLLGTWTTQDRVFVDGPNLYLYAGNRPITAVDPSGLTWYMCLCGAGAGNWVSTEKDCPAPKTADQCCRIRCGISYFMGTGVPVPHCKIAPNTSHCCNVDVCAANCQAMYDKKCGCKKRCAKYQVIGTTVNHCEDACVLLSKGQRDGCLLSCNLCLCPEWFDPWMTPTQCIENWIA